MNGFFGQLLNKCHFEEVVSVGDCLKICPQLDSRVASAGNGGHRREKGAKGLGLRGG